MENREELVFENFHKVYFEFYERTRGLKNNLDATYFNKVPYCADGASKEICLKAFDLIKEYWDIVNKNKMENWCIKLDAENRDVVIKYLNEKYNKAFKGNAIYYGINNNEADYWHGKSSSLREITTEQFIEMIKKEGYKLEQNHMTYQWEFVNKLSYQILATSTNNPPINKFLTELDNDTQNVFDKTLSSLSDLLKYKNDKYGNSALEPLEIFGNKCKVGTRLDDKLARVKNSTELKKNDICDLIGYLTLICVENNWNNFDEFKD